MVALTSAFPKCDHQPPNAIHPYGPSTCCTAGKQRTLSPSATNHPRAIRCRERAPSTTSGENWPPLFSRTGNMCSLIPVACAGRAEIPIIAMGSTGAVGEYHTRADHHFCESIIPDPYVSFARAPIHSSKRSITMNQRTTLTLTTVALLCLGVAVSGLAQAP